MISILPGPIKGILSFSLFLINTLFWILPVLIVSLLKLIIPFGFWQVLSRKVLDLFATFWVSLNSWNIDLINKTKWDVTGLENLRKDDWYLVVCNHQSWVDILVIQKVLLGKIPFLKFFLKKELIWVPLMGIAWWALDFPFMKRYSKEFIKKNPHLKGKDIEITRKACQKYKTIPVSVVNFVEGTRFTKEKHSKQNSPFDKLLKPKAGGVAFVLNAMGDQINNVVNVTIVYPDGVKSFWDLLCGRLSRVKVNIELMPLSDEVVGDYFEDDYYRENFQKWVNSVWEDKDRLIDDMLVS